MLRKHNEKIVKTAKYLRNNATKEERKLWYEFLRKYPIKFSRQKIIANYVLDFYCSKAQIAIELDGSQHYSEEGEVYDKSRTEFLSEYGITVLRIANNHVTQNFEGVCRYIDLIVSKELGKKILW